MLKGDGRLGYTPNPRDHVYRPSVDVFFQSVSQLWQGGVVGVLLTGMGSDGAVGLKTLRNKGHYTIAQDKATSAVYGMPKAAAALEAAVDILPLSQIASKLVSASRHGLATAHNGYRRVGESRMSSSIEYAVMVLLVDDQAMVGEAVRRALANQADIDFHYCASPDRGAQARRVPQADGHPAGPRHAGRGRADARSPVSRQSGDEGYSDHRAVDQGGSGGQE